MLLASRLVWRGRRLAQQPAGAAGGERHQRHEGRGQRRARTSPSSTAGGAKGSRPARMRAGASSPPPNCSTSKADKDDADAIYAALEQEVIPLFYERDEANLPREWIRRSKEAIRTLAPRFSSQRMVIEYIDAALRARRRGRGALGRAAGRGGRRLGRQTLRDPAFVRRADTATGRGGDWGSRFSCRSAKRRRSAASSTWSRRRRSSFQTDESGKFTEGAVPADMAAPSMPRAKR